MHIITQYENEKPTHWDPHLHSHGSLLTPHTCTYTCTHTHNSHVHVHTHATRTRTHAHTHVHTQTNTQFQCIGPLPTAWTDQLQSITIRDFISRVGPTTDIPEAPIVVFELFFSDDLQEEIVRESNCNAKQVMGDQQYQSWTPITVDDLFGFLILMGVNDLPSLDDYWSQDQRLRYGPIADRIPRWRFREMSRYLHFVDNDHLAPRGDPAHDRLGKVRPLIIHLSNKFKTLYEPSKEVAVDEAMIKFQGRSSLKQYMPKKPTKRGIKVWVLGDSTNGYFSQFDVYTGKGKERREGLGAHVVKKLTNFDNFFTSYQLLEDLEKMGFMDAVQPGRIGRSSHRHSRTLV